MRTSFAAVSWSPIDIHRLQPHWSKAKCKEALAELESGLQEAMISAGWFYLETLIGIEDSDFYYDSDPTSCRWTDMPAETEKVES